MFRAIPPYPSLPCFRSRHAQLDWAIPPPVIAGLDPAIQHKIDPHSFFIGHCFIASLLAMTRWWRQGLLGLQRAMTFTTTTGKLTLGPWHPLKDQPHWGAALPGRPVAPVKKRGKDQPESISIPIAISIK